MPIIRPAMFSKRSFIIILTLIAAVETSEIFRLKNVIEKVNLARGAFRVVDAQTHSSIDDFDVTFPAMVSNGSSFPRDLTLLRGKGICEFVALSTQSVAINISKPGYEDFPLIAYPLRYDESAGSLDSDLRTIALLKKPDH